MTGPHLYQTKNRNQDPQFAAFREAMAQELEAILQWWKIHMIDWNRGGFFGRMDAYGQLYPDADRGVIMYTRLLWTYAAASKITAKKEYLAIADRAYTYLLDHFWDDQEGGVYWMVDAEGAVVSDTKQIYAQAFLIYALSEYFELTRNEEVLATAREVFWLVEKYSRDKVLGGYRNVFSREWRLSEDQKLSAKDANQSKIMNTHLHLMEAYCNLHRVCGTASTGEALHRIVRLMIDRFCNRQPRHLHLFFDDFWNPTTAEVSYGHDIECSWLLVEAAGVIGNAGLMEEVNRVALDLAERTLVSGFDKNGGLFEHAASPGAIPLAEKHWWPQAEAVVGFWNAYQLTGKDQYAQIAYHLWDFIKVFFRDQSRGEWHWMIDQSGQPILDREDKAGPWKAPYHNSRMCLEMMQRMDRLSYGA